MLYRRTICPDVVSFLLIFASWLIVAKGARWPGNIELPSFELHGFEGAIDAQNSHRLSCPENFIQSRGYKITIKDTYFWLFIAGMEPNNSPK
jgi:hypothetical protein